MTASPAEAVETARSLINRAHNAIGSGKYSRATVRDWLRQADDILSRAQLDREGG